MRARKQFSSLGRNTSVEAHGLDIKGTVKVGSDCILRGNLVLRTHFSGEVRIGDGCEICDYAMISANELVEIGEGSYIGPFTVLRDNNHLFQGTEAHWRVTPLLIQPIRVGSNCYLGAGCYVMPGVSIGDGAVIAPKTILTKDVGPGELWAGAPGLRIGHRTEGSQRSILKRHQEMMSLFDHPAAALSPEAEAE